MTDRTGDIKKKRVVTEQIIEEKNQTSDIRNDLALAKSDTAAILAIGKRLAERKEGDD